MKLDSRTIDFNKEILIGELGALVGAVLLGLVAFFIHKNPNIVSTLTLLGSVAGGSLSWWIARIHDEKKRNEFSIKKLGRDISLYTPVAILIALLISYPTIFWVTHAISTKIRFDFLGSLAGELSGFALFLVLMNGYRYILKRKFNRVL